MRTHTSWLPAIPAMVGSVMRNCEVFIVTEAPSVVTGMEVREICKVTVAERFAGVSSGSEALGIGTAGEVESTCVDE